MSRTTLVLLMVFAITAAIDAQSQSASSAGTSQGNSSLSQQELTQELSNPVGDLWLIVNEFNISEVKGVAGNRNIYNWNLQPVLPLHVSQKWNLINRPYVPFFIQSPTLGDKPLSLPIQLINDSGIGDVGFISVLSPRKPPPLGRGKFLWGVGPTFLFPTASKSTFGLGKWQAGPSGALAYLDKQWVAGVFVQQWWSFAGSSDRRDQDFAWIQYFLAYQFAPGWQVSAGTPIINVDWKKDNVTFPMGAGIAYTAFLGKLPVEVGLEFEKTVVHPENAPYQDRLFRFSITPVLPALIGAKRSR